MVSKHAQKHVLLEYATWLILDTSKISLVIIIGSMFIFDQFKLFIGESCYHAYLVLLIVLDYNFMLG